MQLFQNGTHQVYTSEISLNDEQVRWQCIYPLESSPHRLEKTILPLESVLQVFLF